MTRFSAFALTLALSAAAPALAEEFKAGDITIDKAWSRATPKGADAGVGYLVIHNNGATPDKLTGSSADFASVEIHEMKNEKGVMTMRELKDGLDIPRHGPPRAGRLPHDVHPPDPPPEQRRYRQGDAQLRACGPS